MFELAVKTIFSLQEERVQIYKEFSNLFKEYLNEIKKSDNSGANDGDNDLYLFEDGGFVAENINFIQFRFMCKQITEKFNKISAQILDIKKLLADNRALFKLIEKLQEYEENKFKLVYLNKV